MGRKIDRAGIVSLFAKLSGRIEGLYLRTSLIVGFPGEGESEFAELMDFVAETRLQHVGVFRYSREEGTRAAKLPDRVQKKTAQKRYDMLMSLQEDISLAHNRNLVGGTADVLVEGPFEEDGRYLRGRFYGQAPDVDGLVIIRGGTPQPGELAGVRFTDAYPYDLAGVVEE
jgi:ribosomal protein S12 methylthiotransferase